MNPRTPAWCFTCNSVTDNYGECGRNRKFAHFILSFENFRWRSWG